ncbi:MAG: serine protease [Planctomycetota bacterium]
MRTHRPVALLLTLLASLFLSPRALAQTADFSKAIEGALDSVYMLGVVRRSDTGPEVFQFIGTGWVIAEGKLATNAHVAESLLEGAFTGRLVAKRSWSDRDELALSAASIRIHPAYAPWNARLKRVVVRSEGDPSMARSVDFIPIADVAIVEVEAGNTAKPLTLADVTKVEPFLSEPVAYLGFPAENISGFPTLHAVPGHVTAKTDFFFLRAPWADSYLIHYCGPVVGGASGSPILNRAGQVLGLISAGENTMSANGERTSFGFAYGQRVDLAAELLRDDFAEVQHRRDATWSKRISELLIPPDELLEQLALGQARNDGVDRLEATNTVTRKEVVVKQGESATLQVTLEAGMRYGFLAAAHDGSDVDSTLMTRGGEAILGQDVELDYFPVLWVGPFDERTAVTYDLHAAELLLQDTVCSLHVYKYEPQVADVSESDEDFDASTFMAMDHGVESDAGYVATWRFQVEAGAQLWFAASSADGYDVDLLIAMDGVILASDETSDSFPLVLHTVERSGVLEMRLRVPAGTPVGSTVTLTGISLGGPMPLYLPDEGGGGSPAPPADQAMSDEDMVELIESEFATSWGDAGLLAKQLDSGFLDGFDETHEFVVDVEPGTLVKFMAISSDVIDLDAAIVQDDAALASDFGVAAVPVVSVQNPNATTATVTFVLYESRLAGGSGRVYYRFESVDL